MNDTTFQSLKKYTFIRPGDELFPDGPIVIRKCNNGDVYVIAPKPLVINKITKELQKSKQWHDYVNSLPQTEEDWVIPSSDDINDVFDCSRTTREFIESGYKWPYNSRTSSLLLSDTPNKMGLRGLSGYTYYYTWFLGDILDNQVWVNCSEDRAGIDISYNVPVTITEYYIDFYTKPNVLPIQRINFTDLYRYL